MREITNNRGIDYFRSKQKYLQNINNDLDKNDMSKSIIANKYKNQIQNEIEEDFFEEYEKIRLSFFHVDKFNPLNYSILMSWFDLNPYITEEEYSEYGDIKKKINIKYLKFFFASSFFQSTGIALYLLLRFKRVPEIGKLLMLGISIACTSIITITLNSKRLNYFKEEYDNKLFMKELINMKYYI